MVGNSRRTLRSVFCWGLRWTGTTYCSVNDESRGKAFDDTLAIRTLRRNNIDPYCRARATRGSLNLHSHLPVRVWTSLSFSLQQAVPWRAVAKATMPLEISIKIFQVVIDLSECGSHARSRLCNETLDSSVAEVEEQSRDLLHVETCSRTLDEWTERVSFRRTNPSHL